MGPLAYKVDLLLNLVGVHDVFHVLTLQKYTPDHADIVHCKSLHIQGNLSYEEVSVEVQDKKDQELHTKKIPLVKVLWCNHAIEETSWDLEHNMCIKYLQLF